MKERKSICHPGPFGNLRGTKERLQRDYQLTLPLGVSESYFGYSPEVDQEDTKGNWAS